MEAYKAGNIQVLYVGDARNVRKRILNNHRRGNVESSILRKHIASKLGLKIKTELRTNGCYRIRIDEADKDSGEREISEYVKCGMWRVILVHTYEEAHELQWYIKGKLSPPFNRRIKIGEGLGGTNYGGVFQQLMESPLLGLDEIAKLKEGPGVYVFYNVRTPEQ
jgi:hypothetical protein